jgi:hypothetical protein
MHPKLEYP